MSEKLQVYSQREGVHYPTFPPLKIDFCSPPSVFMSLRSSSEMTAWLKTPGNEGGMIEGDIGMERVARLNIRVT